MWTRMFYPKFQAIALRQWRQIYGLADPQYMDKGHVDVLLGATVYSRILEGTVIKGDYNESIATRSVLGWLLTGRNSSWCKAEAIKVKYLARFIRFKAWRNVEKFWVQEVLAAPLYTEEDQACEGQFVRTYSRNEQGILRPSFKDLKTRGKLNLSQSVYLSQMLFKLEKKFSTGDRLKKMYHDYLTEFEDLDHMSLVSLSEVNSFLDCFYEPHHGVWTEKSSSI